MSILLYGCTTWTLTKRLEKKLDGNYTRILRAILNKSWRQHPTNHRLYGHLPPITKTIEVRRARHAGHCWRSRYELISDVLLLIPTYGRAKAGRPAEHTYSSYVRIRDVAQKTCQRRWTIGKSVDRWSGISDMMIIYIYIYIYIIKDCWTIAFIFIVISTTFRPICLPAFFRCLSNSGTYTELRTTFFIESTGVACSDSVSHN